MISYQKVVGLEIHVRVKSRTKLFCGCRNALELAESPNIHICPVCMGFPGMLPRVNKEVMRLWVIAGMMMHCEVNKISRFDRKSYFYPDLPNSFQTTQMYEPIVWAWYIEALVGNEIKRFDIHHMHLENDAGKLTHTGGKTLCDYNRAWSPLMEIVTEPVFHKTEEVLEFLRELQKLMRAAWVSDVDMDKGQLRCDVNISLRPKGDTKLYNRVELKNLNSFSSIGRAIETESKRQEKLLRAWQIIVQETRGWDDTTGMSSSQRSKEDAMDYRYFPEPDILPIVLDEVFLEWCREALMERPIEKRMKYLKEYHLWDDDARILSADFELAAYFEKLVELTGDPKKSCSYLTSVILGLMASDENKKNISELNFEVTELARVIELVNADELSSTAAKQVIEELYHNWWKAESIVDENNLRQKNDLWLLESIVDQILAENISQVAEYKAWKDNLFGYFVGQCMKVSKGQGNPKVFTELLKKKL